MRDRLFGPSLTTPEVEAAVADTAWLQAMLDFEAALARAEARCGLLPAGAAEAIGARCRAGLFDVSDLGRAAAAAGTPVIPLVGALRDLVAADARGWVHFGATSQDVLDTAAMLVAREALALVAADLDGLAAGCAKLADRHRETAMAGRTLLQQALPISFGLKAAGWLMQALDARERLTAYRRGRLAVQLGGAAGTLAALGPRGLEVVRELAVELRLVEPPLPWHTNRARIAELGGLLAVISGVAAKIALDVVLLAQTEVGEAAEPVEAGSSAMPHKRNPAAAVAVLAAARGVTAEAGVLFEAMAGEHERAAGAWQSEQRAVAEALRLAAGAVARARRLTEGLRIDAARMRANLDLTRGLVLSESAAVALAGHVGLPRAQELVRAAVRRAEREGSDLGSALLADPAVTEHLDAAAVTAALRPEAYLGASSALIDRALAAYRAAGPVEGGR